MKKILIISMFVLLAAVNVVVITNSNDASNISLNSLFNIAIANGETNDPPIGYNKKTGDCSIELSGEAGVPIKIFGITYYFNSGGSLTLTFYDVSVDCQYGGYSVNCTDVTCADFWSGR